MEDNGMKYVIESLVKRIDELMSNIAPKIYTTETLCEYLHIAPKTLNKMRTHGKINYVRVGKKFLYTQSDVDGFINKNKFVFD